MTTPDKTQLETELLEAEKKKVLAEIDVLRKTTPLTETIKIVGSMILGAGGAIAAIAGFQLAEVKSEKYKLEAAVAERARDDAKSELVDLEKKVQTAKTEYEAISERIKIVQSQAADNAAVSATLKTLQEDVNAADIELRTSIPSEAAITSEASLESVVENLFAPTASVRGAAYEEIMAHFSKNRKLVPNLISFAKKSMANQNGIYNTLVVLSHLDHGMLESDLESIKEFAKKARPNGPRTSERADKLLKRLP